MLALPLSVLSATPVKAVKTTNKSLISSGPTIYTPPKGKEFTLIAPCGKIKFVRPNQPEGGLSGIILTTRPLDPPSTDCKYNIDASSAYGTIFIEDSNGNHVGSIYFF